MASAMAFSLLGKAHDRGARTAEPTGKRASFHATGNNIIEHRNELLAIGLVELVVEQAAQQGIVTCGKNRGDECDAIQIFDSIP